VKAAPPPPLPNGCVRLLPAPNENLSECSEFLYFCIVKLLSIKCGFIKYRTLNSLKPPVTCVPMHSVYHLRYSVDGDGQLWVMGNQIKLTTGSVPKVVGMNLLKKYSRYRYTELIVFKEGPTIHFQQLCSFRKSPSNAITGINFYSLFTSS
jgi:hypothetical protein